MRCYPSPGSDSAPSMVLERASPPRRMMLLREADEFLLRDDRCSTLAVASDLPALFDAVDAGLAES
jgi:hypothetical protein